MKFVSDRMSFYIGHSCTVLYQITGLVKFMKSKKIAILGPLEQTFNLFCENAKENPKILYKNNKCELITIFSILKPFCRHLQSKVLKFPCNQKLAGNPLLLSQILFADSIKSWKNNEDLSKNKRMKLLKQSLCKQCKIFRQLLDR